MDMLIHFVLVFLSGYCYCSLFVFERGGLLMFYCVYFRVIGLLRISYGDGPLQGNFVRVLLGRVLIGLLAFHHVSFSRFVGSSVPVV